MVKNIDENLCELLIEYLKYIKFFIKEDPEFAEESINKLIKDLEKK